MSDQKSPNEPPFESDIDEVLAHAESLAADLSAELGIVDVDTVEPELDALPDSENSTAAVVEEQLARVDDLAAKTAEELGATGEEEGVESHEGEGDAEPAVEPAPASIPPAVPDFMDEFTHAEEPAAVDPATESAVQTDLENAKIADFDDAPPESAAEVNQGESAALSEPAVGAQPSPSPGLGSTSGRLGVVKSRPVGVVGNIPPKASEAVEGAEPDAFAEAEGHGGEEVSEQPVRSLKERVAEKMKPMVQAALKGMSPIALTASDLVIKGLEVIDRPTANLKASIKAAVGLLALATTGTSIVLLLLSFF